MTREGMKAEIEAFGEVPNWEREFGRAANIDNGVCMTCDLPVAFTEDGEHGDDEVCHRYKPYCLNHDNKVDWRARCLAAESEVERITAECVVQMESATEQLQAMEAGLAGRLDIRATDHYCLHTYVDGVCAGCGGGLP